MQGNGGGENSPLFSDGGVFDMQLHTRVLENPHVSMRRRLVFLLVDGPEFVPLHVRHLFRRTLEGECKGGGREESSPFTEPI